jgi:hypothetical protein
MDDPCYDQSGNGLLTELILFLRLANGFRERLRMADRDRALVIAACCAELNQMPAVAEFCRQLILQNNHGHMVRRWPTMGDALQHPDFVHFLRQLRRKMPLEAAEVHLIQTGYRCDVQRPDYADDKEYVAAVMGIDCEWLDENFG